MRRQVMDSLRKWLPPSLGDVVLAAIGGQLFFFRQGWSALLGDGDTGWHIRAGEWILRNRSVPTTDLFSFSRPGAPWSATQAPGSTGWFTWTRRPSSPR